MIAAPGASEPDTSGGGPSFKCSDGFNSGAADRFSKAVFALLLLLLPLSLCGCASRTAFQGGRPFAFEKDTFAYANELVWEYSFDEQGNWRHRRRQPEPDYTHHCFVVARSARQFFQHATFSPDQPQVDDATYRRLIRQVVRRDPARGIAEDRRVVLPGYASLREFSEAKEDLLKQECGGAWRSYFQRGHWRVVFPFRRAHQARTAEELVKAIRENRPPVVHLIRFPQLTINHAVVLFDARETGSGIEFATYDPNKPERPQTLTFDRARRTFSFPSNDYWPGGDLNVYEIYRSAVY